MRYEVKNISPSGDVVSTLEKQMEAEREKRSEITLAKAEKESRINLSEGERQEAINLSEGEKQKKINEAKGKAQEITILAEASAQGINMVADAINQPGGPMAIKMELVENFIKNLGEIMEGSDISVLPNEMANIKGIFEGTKEISKTIQKG